MPNAPDLFVIPLFRRDGQDQPYLPGLHIMAAPKRAARGRAGERLILQLSLPSEINLSAEQQHHLLADLAEGYFRTPGAVTSALREQAERLNAYFVQQSQKTQPAAARLSMLSVREDHGTLAQSGPLHAFQLSDENIEHLFDPQVSGRGLGLTQNTEIRFFQCQFTSGAFLLLLSELPTGWSEKTLSNVGGQKLSTLRRRFLSEAGQKLQGVLIASQPGSGRLTMLTSFETEQVSPPPATKAEVPKPANPILKTDPIPVHTYTELEPEIIPQAPTPLPVSNERTEIQKPKLAGEISTRVAQLWARVLPNLRKLLLKLLPEETAFNLPRKTLLLAAILVPLLVVVLVSAVYLQVGRGQLYFSYLSRAQSAASLAEAKQDPAEIRQAWQAALFYAQRAVVYEKDGTTAQDLTNQAQSALDEMDAISRVDFQPALFSALPRTTNIVKIAATSTDLFLLNSTNGNILRAFLTGGGYQLDQDFHCEPGPYGGIIVSPLVDLALLPRGNSLGAALVAMDGNGNLIYCIVGERPLAVSLIPPDSNWGKPNSIAVENGNLYVLDPLTNAVWIYSGEDDSFVQPPRFFFGAKVPDMQHALDFDMDGQKIYLLDADGSLSTCEFSDNIDNPTTCADSFEFTDPRPGRQNGPTIADAHFLQIQLTDPPEPSIFLFDPIVPSVYQFSERLNLVTQFQTRSTLPSEVATAFAVSPNHAIFLAFANEIYIGFMP